MSSLNDSIISLSGSGSEVLNPYQILKQIKRKNENRLIIGQININSLRNKFQSLETLIKGNIDILVITESKLDGSFPTQQFAIEGYSLP